jgi:hypothetical protein
MMAYHHRAQKAPTLQWLIQRDIEERTRWVELFGSSAKELGAVVKEVMQLRSAHWEVESPLPSLPNAGGGTVAQQKGAGKGTKGNKSGQASASASPVSQLAKTLRDGAKLCNAYNTARGCQENPCSKGKRRCSLVLKNGRVCGSHTHCAANCDNRRR